jgi:hypothetical protein
MDGQDTQVGRSDGLETQIAVKSPMGGIIYNVRLDLDVRLGARSREIRVDLQSV